MTPVHKEETQPSPKRKQSSSGVPATNQPHWEMPGEREAVELELCSQILSYHPVSPVPGVLITMQLLGLS